MSRAALLLGAELFFLRIRLFWNKLLVPDSFAAGGRTCSHESRHFFEQATCPRRLRCRRQNFQEFWDSCAQNKTSEIPNIALSGTLGPLCGEQNVGNLKNMHFQECLGLMCAEQNVGNIKKCTFRNSGTLGRRTKRRKSKKNELLDMLGLLCAEQHVGNL